MDPRHKAGNLASQAPKPQPPGFYPATGRNPQTPSPQPQTPYPKPETLTPEAFEQVPCPERAVLDETVRPPRAAK